MPFDSGSRTSLDPSGKSAITFGRQRAQPRSTCHPDAGRVGPAGVNRRRSTPLGITVGRAMPYAAARSSAANSLTAMTPSAAAHSARSASVQLGRAHCGGRQVAARQHRRSPARPRRAQVAQKLGFPGGAFGDVRAQPVKQGRDSPAVRGEILGARQRAHLDAGLGHRVRGLLGDQADPVAEPGQLGGQRQVQGADAAAGDLVQVAVHERDVHQSRLAAACS
jgi:hypothetical protein